MVQAYIEKLALAGGQVTGLSAEDRAVLLTLRDDVRPFLARCPISREGDRMEHVSLIIDGWACRQAVLRDGSRQITAFLLPGDFCEAHATLFDRVDHGLVALTNCQVAMIPRRKMSEIMRRPRIARALQWAALIDEAMLRAWIVNLGRRDAFDRMGHLVCELHARLSNLGLADHDEFTLPLTQEELADSLGLTPVHVNRTLRRLREEGLVTVAQRRLVMLDVPRLRKLVGFNPNYLHLPQRTTRPPADDASVAGLDPARA